MAERFSDPEKKSRVIATLAILAAVVVLIIGVEIYVASSDVAVSVSADAIDIDDGDFTVALKEITAIAVKTTMPAVEGKVRGRDALFATGKKGLFRLEGAGERQIFLHSGEGPFLYLHTADDYVILSFKDPQRAEAVAREIGGKLIPGGG